jgi:hypothetical protein
MLKRAGHDRHLRHLTKRKTGGYLVTSDHRI